MRGVRVICDYSLSSCASRDAEVGETLVSGRIRMSATMWRLNSLSCTKGFHAENDDSVAVCLRPGTELAFEEDVRIKLSLGVDGLGSAETPIPHKVARFREINEDNKYVHHDALEFPSGHVILLNDLAEGQKCKVLQLPATQKRFHPEDQKCLTSP